MPTTIVAPNRGNRPITETSFTDLTSANVTELVYEEGGMVTVTFDADLTRREQYEVRRRIRCTEGEEAREKRAVTIHQQIENFVNTPNSGITNAAVVAQVKLNGQLLQSMLKTAYPEARVELLGE